MKLLKLISRINATSFLRLFRLGLKNITKLWPTYRATKKCMRLATAHFGRKHYQNGQANAFRHALWNYLISKHCAPWSRNHSSALLWTKAITDWHEEAFFSKELPMKMDFHNNNVGRHLFEENPRAQESEAVEQLVKLTKNSKLITLESDLSQLKTQLVHIKDDT